tara:strand:+ start:5284 stop:6054 length:771 start_codon:yes stop_codon:yes gene_type:complete
MDGKMKKVLLATTLLSFVLSTSVLAKSVSIRADHWFPMNGDPDSGNEGFMIDIAREVFAAGGYTVDYKLMPWERAIDSTRKGETDCIVGAYVDDAPDFLFPSENWGMDVTGYFTNTDSAWSFSGLNSLLDQKVGVIDGYAYGEELDVLVAERKDVFKAVSGGNSLETNFKKLLAKRVDVVVESVAVGLAKVKELNLADKIKLAGKDSTSAEIYISCSPVTANGKELIELVDKQTAALRASGQLEKILTKYGLSDWK